MSESATPVAGTGGSLVPADRNAPAVRIGAHVADRQPTVARPGVRTRPTRSPTWMLDQLPVGLLQEDFFVRFVSIFQELGTTLLDGADNVANVLDLDVAPPPMVRWLASWIDSPAADAAMPEDLQRRMVQGSTRSLTLRGTRAGLQTFVEQLTGHPAEVVDGGGVYAAGEAPDSDPAWVRVSVPSSGWVDPDGLAALVAREIPAHVLGELVVDGTTVWTSDRPTASRRRS